jgi:hypothetical protein
MKKFLKNLLYKQKSIFIRNLMKCREKFHAEPLAREFSKKKKSSIDSQVSFLKGHQFECRVKISKFFLLDMLIGLRMRKFCYEIVLNKHGFCINNLQEIEKLG